MQRLAEANASIDTENPRGGINVHFDLASNEPLQQSPTWQSAGWSVTYLVLSAHTELDLVSGDFHAKVITGHLANPNRRCLGEPIVPRSTQLIDSVIQAGDLPCLFALMERTQACPENLTDIEQLVWRGDCAEALRWQTFEARFAGLVDAFDGQDCYMANGFHLLDRDGTEIVYVNPWCCGKGVDLTTHNHAQSPRTASPAFAEIHWVFNNGTGLGGMYEITEPGAIARTSHPLQAGEEHGPYFKFDENGRPSRLPNGAVVYPWHGWQGGQDELPGQTYDYIAAFEINPDYISR
ncbi:MAG: hypothetical protein GKR90_15980 [Pseudomonadales bacterium]|nr:hypothetical protein [Pseudomonadales bacterium]